MTRASSPPRQLSSFESRFPDAAAEDQRTELLVPVRVWIDERGAVTHAALRRPSDRRFDEAALRVAHAARFAPATANGVPVPSGVTVLIHFGR